MFRPDRVNIRLMHKKFILLLEFILLWLKYVRDDASSCLLLLLLLLLLSCKQWILFLLTTVGWYI